MLGIAINNEFLTLDPDTALEMERSNPFIQFGDEIQGDYSLPFNVKNTPVNLRLLQYAGLIQSRMDNTGIDAKAYDSGLQHSIGKIKIEKPQHHLMNSKDGSISCYYLTGFSSFYQDIKNVKLRSINVGGDRTFAWDSPEIYTYLRNGNGFWGHIHKVIDASPGSYDYAFYPVINREWAGQYVKSDVLNLMEYSSGQINFSSLTTDKRWANAIVPFPYLQYVLKQAVAHIGWRIEGDIFQDADFKKVTLLNFRAIDWGFYNPFATTRSALARTTITFNLQDHLPDMTIAAFLLAIKNRFGFWYDFDRHSKVIRIKTLPDVALGTVKNMSTYASPIVLKTVNEEKKTYALRNEFIGNYSNPNLKAVTYKGELSFISNLPAAADTLYGNCYLIISENNYYICRQNEDSQAWEWQLFAYNVSDYEPENANEDITTKATAVGSEKYDNYLDLVPRFDLNGEWVGQTDEQVSWNVHLLFYHGIRNNKSNQPYPFASSGIYDSKGQPVANWSLAFVCKKFDGTDVGLYALNWKKLLDTLNSNETFEVTLNLPLTEYLQLQFDDIISINNVRMYITKIKSKIPYTGSVTLECSRI